MSPVLLAAIAVILCILFRTLNVNSQAQKPVVWCKDKGFLESLLYVAPMLGEPWVSFPSIFKLFQIHGVHLFCFFFLFESHSDTMRRKLAITLRFSFDYVWNVIIYLRKLNNTQSLWRWKSGITRRLSSILYFLSISIVHLVCKPPFFFFQCFYFLNYYCAC